MSGAPPAVDYISRSEAIVEIARLVTAQSEAFQFQAQQTAALNDETRKLLADIRAEVTLAGTVLRKEALGYKATADAQIDPLREEARVAIASLTEQSSSIEDDVPLRAAEFKAFEEKMNALEAGIRGFADESRAEMTKTLDDVTRTQGEVVRIQSGIQASIEGARPEGSGPFSPAAQERDRPVFDPRDYKLDTLTATLSFGT